jgi:hypothetical protein
VIQASGLAVLIAGVGDAVLQDASVGPARGATVALAAITMVTDEERGLAARAAAPDFAQHDNLSMARIWHAPIAQALDNRKPFLSL